MVITEILEERFFINFLFYNDNPNSKSTKQGCVLIFKTRMFIKTSLICFGVWCISSCIFFISCVGLVEAAVPTSWSQQVKFRRLPD